MNAVRYDVLIAGGGPVGAALALELNRSGLDIALIEARPAAAAPADSRPLALSYGSRLILERLGVWSSIAPATTIERVHISQRGHFGRALLTAEEAGLPALGYVVDYASLVALLDSAVHEQNVRVERGARVTHIAHDSASARVEYANAHGVQECHASVVVIADGNAGTAGVEVRVREYGQTALTARVHSAIVRQATAYERFTPTGPLALLPFGEDYALVWTLAPQQAEEMVFIGPEMFLARLDQNFGERLGRFTSVTSRALHPLALRIAERTTSGRAVIIGNAAQSLHPVAGQGFNLGLRDAWELAIELKRCGVVGDRVLRAYAARRRIDRRGGIAFTDTLVRLFSNDVLPIALARGAGLCVLDSMPPAKDFVARRMIFGARG